MPTKIKEKKNTREQLLLAAIRTFAAHGIRATSLRQVNEAAGTKNSGAVHYYFKNKYGLIEAAVAFIYSNMITEISDEELAEAGLPRVKDLRGVRRIIYEHFLPMLITYEEMPWGKTAIGFLAHLMMESDPKIQKVWENISGPAAQSTLDLLARELPALPRAQLERRYLFALVNLVHGLADSQSLPGTSFGNVGKIDDATLLVELINYITAGIKAKP